MARTIIHESIHAQFLVQNPEIDDHHEYMASKEMRGQMIQYLKQYAEKNDLKFTDREYEVLSWGGLQETQAFGVEFDTDDKFDQFKLDQMDIEMEVEIVDK